MSKVDKVMRYLFPLLIAAAMIWYYNFNPSQSHFSIPLETADNNGLSRMRFPEGIIMRIARRISFRTALQLFLCHFNTIRLFGYNMFVV